MNEVAIEVASTVDVVVVEHVELEMTKAIEDITKLKQSITDFQEKKCGQQQIIENIFSYLQDSIEIRIESIKISLELEKQKLNKKLKRLKTEFKKSQNKKVKLDCLSKHMCKKTLDGPSITQTTEKCFRLNVYGNSAQFILKDFLFKSNAITPTVQQIGRINGITINFNKLQVVEPKRIEFTDILVTDMCSDINNDQLFIVNQENNQIILTDKYLNIKERLLNIDDVFFNSPCSICTNLKDTIFICDKLNDRIVCVNKKLNKVKGLVKDPELIKQPVYVAFFKDSLYILNENCKFLMQFKPDGVFVNKIELALPQDGLEIQKFHITQTNIFLLAKSIGVLIFDLSGNYIDSINSITIVNSFLLMDSCIAIMNLSGLVSIYEIENSKLNLNPIFKRSVSNCCMALNLACVDNFLYLYYRWSTYVNYDSHFFIFEC